MVKIICGPKGSGKTKRIIDAANEAVDTSDYSIAGEDALCGFIKGVVAGSYDNEYVYVDGIARIAGKAIKDMAQFFYMMEKVAQMRDLKLYITCSCAEEDLPDFAKKYL